MSEFDLIKEIETIAGAIPPHLADTYEKAVQALTQANRRRHEFSRQRLSRELSAIETFAHRYVLECAQQAEATANDHLDEINKMVTDYIRRHGNE